MPRIVLVGLLLTGDQHDADHPFWGRRAGINIHTEVTHVVSVLMVPELQHRVVQSCELDTGRNQGGVIVRVSLRGFCVDIFSASRGVVA